MENLSGRYAEIWCAQHAADAHWLGGGRGVTITVLCPVCGEEHSSTGRDLEGAIEEWLRRLCRGDRRRQQTGDWNDWDEARYKEQLEIAQEMVRERGVCIDALQAREAAMADENMRLQVALDASALGEDE